MDIVTKKQLNILIQLAEADKHFAKIEREMIFKIAKERKFPEEEVNELIRTPSLSILWAPFHWIKVCDYLISSIELVFADQNIFESEIIFCKNIAIKLGFKKGIIDFFIENFGTKPIQELKEAALADLLTTHFSVLPAFLGLFVFVELFY